MSWREIPGSFLESGDDEGRTWDEITDRRSVTESDDDDDYNSEDVTEDITLPSRETVRPNWDPYGDARRELALALADDERLHWRLWVGEDRSQTEIAARIGISQPAVQKREKVLRAKANAIWQPRFGQDYPFPPRKRGPKPGRL